MLTKSEIIEQALALGFEDIGFTGAGAFESQAETLLSRKEMHSWVAEKGLDLMQGTDPGKVYPEAKSIIVLMENYFRKAFPPSMEGMFGRCYLDDDRITKDGLSRRIQAFRNYLHENGIESKVPFNIPHCLAAARAGLGTFGKNCLLYSRKAARRGSWILPVAVVVNFEFAPDDPTMEVGCPQWCRNACIAACPTGALIGPRKIDPRRCISFLSYYGEGITPIDLREPMGMWVYGCDHCQNVCPRNKPWLAQDLPAHDKVAAMSRDFELQRLLHMDEKYFTARIWPRMFYMPPREIWRWKMNAARVMGNSRDPQYIPDLARAFWENEDERVKGMAAWALGQIGGPEAGKALEGILDGSNGMVREEIIRALEK